MFRSPIRARGILAMADVFISYKKEDFREAQRVAEALRSDGLSVWWDDHLTPRDAWDAELEREIAAAGAVVVLWTELSVKSDWVRTEAHYAAEHGKLVPVLLRNCAVPLAFSLRQTVNLTAWQGDAQARDWRKFLSWVSDLTTAATRSPASLQPAQAAKSNPYREIVAQLPSGESVVDGSFVNASTPAGTAFRDADGLPVLRLVAPGAFLRGASSGDPDASSFERPQHRVEIPRPFGIGIFPVLADEYARVMGALPPGMARPQHARQPVTHVSFADAEAFLRRLSEMTGETYRLPSESEWEYACRAGRSARYDGGDEITPEHACFGLTEGPIEAGRFPPNAFGLFDMRGNVREWTADLWHDSHDFSPLDGSPALEGHGSLRVVRGGSWIDAPQQLRSSARMRATESVRAAMIGLRVVRVMAS